MLSGGVTVREEADVLVDEAEDVAAAATVGAEAEAEAEFADVEVGTAGGPFVEANVIVSV